MIISICFKRGFKRRSVRTVKVRSKGSLGERNRPNCAFVNKYQTNHKIANSHVELHIIQLFTLLLN